MPYAGRAARVSHRFCSVALHHAAELLEVELAVTVGIHLSDNVLGLFVGEVLA